MKRQNTSNKLWPPMATPVRWYSATHSFPTDYTIRRADQEERCPIVMLCVQCVRSNEACPEPTGCQGHLPVKCDTQTLDKAKRLCVWESDTTGVIRIRFTCVVCLPPMWGIYTGKVPQSEVEEVQTYIGVRRLSQLSTIWACLECPPCSVDWRKTKVLDHQPNLHRD